MLASNTNKRKKSFKAAPSSPPTTLKYCNKCDFQTNDLNEFTEHMKFEHSLDEIYPCDMCSFFTESLWDYQVHMEKTHLEENRMHESESEDILEAPEEEFDEDDEDDNKESILYSSSSSSSISFNPKKNSDEIINKKINFDNQNSKMIFDLANQYQNQSQLTQLIQKYNQQMNQQQQQQQHQQQQQQQRLPQIPMQEKAKRHYNSEVDPARYRKVFEEGITKFACSICGNTYKWRKSLNKHWKEKHITETPPPLDAPVAVKLRNGNTTLNSTPPPPPPVPAPLVKKLDNNPMGNVLNVFQQYLNSQLPVKNDDTSAPLDLSMKPKRERSQSPSISQRSHSASSTSSSSNSSTSASSSDSSETNSTLPTEATQHNPQPDTPKQQPIAQSQLNNTSSSSSQAYNQKLFICSICDAKFHVVDQINEHFLKNHYNEYQRELSSKSPPRNTNVAQQNEEWNLSDPQNPLKCIKCDFVGRWPTELQKHAASHSTSRPFKCLICSLTYKWRWDLAKHFDRTHPTFRNPYKKRDRDAARSTIVNPTPQVRRSRSRSRSNESEEAKKLKYEAISINPHTPPLSSSSSSSSSSTCSLQPNFLPPFLSPQSQNTAAMYAAYLLANPAFLSNLNNPLFAMAALQNAQIAPLDTTTITKKKFDEPIDMNKQVKHSTSNTNVKKLKLDESDVECKEARNFQCFWCDFRGRWRSEIIQHMRCHHAREKPYRCSTCMYASNWKWDVQKHTKKQHPNNISVKIIEVPDQVLFPDLKDLNFFDCIKQVGPESSPKKAPSINLTPPSSSSSSSSTSSISSISSSSIRPNKKSTMNCAQCPYVACNLSDLRRHLIVHSNEQPYHCCTCSFKSKWKSDVKKHQRSSGHIGPILVGKKAMQKVIEKLGLDKKADLVNIDNRQCKSNEKLIDEEDFNNRKKDVEDSDEEVYEQLNDDEEYFDDEEDAQMNSETFEEEFPEDEEGELEIDQDDDEY
ncbi:unnamed protein product [Brachionus calyciflorus]|uniref:C2H2-type domain-containing protein n=1 Tax=Brachionus calyciflorus TaxID=104777 RepID=A0A813Q720_9BILA|nr:unnamed protein product [Brachionus calyciflorus]